MNILVVVIRLIAKIESCRFDHRDAEQYRNNQQRGTTDNAGGLQGLESAEYL